MNIYNENTFPYFSTSLFSPAIMANFVLEKQTKFMSDISGINKICPQIRRDIVRMVHAVNSGHPGGSLGCTEFFTALYFDVMKHNPTKWDMNGTDQDLFLDRKSTRLNSSH